MAALPLGGHAAGLGDLARGVVVQGGRHQVVAVSEVSRGQLAELGREPVEDLEVRAGLPRRVDRRVRTRAR